MRLNPNPWIWIRFIRYGLDSLDLEWNWIRIDNQLCYIRNCLHAKLKTKNVIAHKNIFKLELLHTKSHPIQSKSNQISWIWTKCYSSMSQTIKYNLKKFHVPFARTRRHKARLILVTFLRVEKTCYSQISSTTNNVIIFPKGYHIEIFATIVVGQRTKYTSIFKFSLAMILTFLGKLRDFRKNL